ncbi:hypothetical protein ANN_13766 [Periplaneta americana]|uniref:Uncharacterized protein n=1 Tax=Periplaneta americana TaxID=6978 RepID=A0ABQ8SV06_PERAM|nr:hypothetical protein ANN_13766 [Periplaneta americana]
MGPKTDKVIEENMEDCVTRVLKDALQEQAMLEGIANISVIVVSELRATLDKNTEVIKQLEQSLKGRQNSKTGSTCSGKNRRPRAVPKASVSANFWCAQGKRRGHRQDSYRYSEKKNGVELKLEDIDRSHMVGRRIEGDTRPVIVKFVSYRKRSQVFRNNVGQFYDDP